MNAHSMAVAPSREDSLAHVKAAGWGRGVNALVRITRMTLRHPWQAGAAIGATFVAAALQLAIPRLLGRAVDQTQAVMAGGGAEAALWTTAVTLFVVSVFRGLFTMVQNYYGELVGHHVGYELRLAFYEKVQRLSFGFHDRVHSGDLITIGMLDLEGVRMFFSTGIVRTVLLTMLIGIGSVMLISTEPTLGLLSLSFVPFVAWRSSVTHLALRATWLELQERLSVLSRVMEENLGGIRVVRAFAAQAYELLKFDRASKDALGLAHRRVGIRVRNTSAMSFSFFLAMGLVLWVGGRKVAGGRDDGRDADLVPDLHDHPADAGAPARADGELLLARLDLRRAAVRIPRSRGRDRRPAGREAARRHRRHAALRGCELRLRRDAAGGAQRRQLRGAARRDDRHRRPAGQRQVDDRAPDPAVLRRDRRADHHRRAGHPRRDARIAAAGGGGGAAGRLPVHDDAREQHRLRRPLGRRAADRAGKHLGAAARLRARAADRLPAPWSASAGCRCRAGSGSGWRSRGR